MTEAEITSSGPNEAHVSVARGPLVGAVLGRVVGMLAARAQCPIDRLDDALLITDAVAAHAPRFSSDDRVNVVVRTDEDSLEIVVGPLADGGTEGLVADATLPGVGNVLERVADEVDRSPGEQGEQLRIRLSFSTT
jgi:serine/threonine-protein kinase RsbW